MLKLPAFAGAMNALCSFALKKIKKAILLEMIFFDIPMDV